MTVAKKCRVWRCSDPKCRALVHYDRFVQFETQRIYGCSGHFSTGYTHPARPVYMSLELLPAPT